MGAQCWIMVSDPFLAHKIFVSHGVETSFRPHLVFCQKYYARDGKGIVFSQPDPTWKKTRTAALSILAPKNIDIQMDNMVKESQDMVDRLMAASLSSTARSQQNQGSCTDSDGISPIDILNLRSTNIITKTCFGVRFESVNDPNFKEWADIVCKMMKFAAPESNMATFFPAFFFVDYFAGTLKKMKHCLDTRCVPAIERFIEDAKLKKEPNLVKSLVEGDFNLTNDDLIVFFSDLAIAGTDSAYVSLSWNLVIMCNYPEAQARASAEIDKFVLENNRLPSFKDRNEVPFCISVMKECLRYKPLLPFGLPHCATADINVDGYTIPKGVTLLSSMEAMHQNPNVYSDPETFKPDRFLSSPKTMLSAANGKIEERDQYNFGWGRRTCPAIHMAEVEIFLGFIEIYSRCTVEPANGAMPDIDGAVDGGLILIPLPYKVKFVERTNRVQIV